MNIAFFAEAALAATVVASLTDWFFFGVLFHSHYQAYPEIWRQEFSGGNEWKAVLMATAISAGMACAFLFLGYRLGLHGYLPVLQLALAIWLIAALPATLTNFIFVKLHPKILISHSLGWLARLAVLAASFALILDR